MDIVRERQEKRASYVNNIREWLIKAKESGKEIDEKKLVLAVMDKMNLSRRTAKEYVELAYFDMTNKSFTV